MPPRFVIVGTGRSGSAYISHVLRVSGINCGHEEYWNVDPSKKKENLDGDSSWLATFDKSYSGIRFAQFRNPLESIPSIFNSQFKGDLYKEWDDIRRRDIQLGSDSRINAVKVYNGYTLEALSASTFWWRVEDVDEKVINKISRLTGFPISGKQVSWALSTTTKNKNTRGLTEGFEWPDCPEVEQTIDLSRRLGYECTFQ